MVLECSFVTKKADRRCAFEEVVFICRNTGCFLDDRLGRATDECAVVPRAGYVSRDDKESGRKAEAIHNRHGYAELINRSIIISERDCPVLAVLPFCHFRLTDLADGK